MHLIQILLPLYDNQLRPVNPALLEEVTQTLSGRFGGLTAYTRSPAEGRWGRAGGEVKDDIVVYEIMAEAVDAAWWADYRRLLEERFEQEQVVIRAWAMDLL